MIKKFKKKPLFFLYNLIEKLFHKISSSEIEAVKSTGLFNSLDAESFDKLINSLSFVHFPAGSLILREGEKADSFYILLEGSVRVFTMSQHGGKIPLARLEKGTHFGEAALLKEESKIRNASIEAITDTYLINIKEKYIVSALKTDQKLEARLRGIGKQQIVNNLLETVRAYKSISEIVAERFQDKIIEIEKDEVLFRQGDQPDYIYIILEGKINIHIQKEPAPINCTLQKGLLFGELAVINNAPRAGTAVTMEPSRLIRISTEEFKSVCLKSPQISGLLKTLGKTYSLPNNGFVQQYAGNLMGMEVITTEYQLGDRVVIASHASERDYFVMEEATKPKSSLSYIYQKEKSNKVELDIADDRIVSIKTYGVWEDLPKACEALLEGRSIEKPVLEEFENTGQFAPVAVPEFTVPDIVCQCMSVSRSRVEDLIDRGIRSLSQISQETSACTVCGSCRNRILAMLGQNVWLPALMKKVKEHNHAVSSYLIQPTFGKFTAFTPGMHLVLQVRINDMWFERAYTISDLMHEDKLRITVKKERNGFFTGWLFDVAKAELPIYVSQPQGLFTLSQRPVSSILCIAGGIGITPFITFAKSYAAEADPKPFRIVYIAPSEEDFIFLDEFGEITSKHSWMELELWDRQKKGRLSTTALKKAIEELKRPDIYICGPEGFETSLLNSLQEISYPADKIHQEIFTYASPIISNDGSGDHL